VQADSKDWKPWRNRTYDETVKHQDRFPEQYRILAEMDPQHLGGRVPPLELYDLHTDPDEMRTLATSPAHRTERDRLYAALRKWVVDTADPAVAPPVRPPEASRP
jgi:N-sulfoglucosamine sulfohydrolase